MKLSHPLFLSAAGALVAITAVAGSAIASPDRQPPALGDGPMMGGAMAGGPIMAQDKDKDGQLSLNEFLSPKEARFAQIDTNKDGSISPEEYAAAPAPTDAMAKRQADWAAKATAAEKSLRDARKTSHFRALDADGNGKISQDEYLAMGKLMFAALDQNNDGKVNARDPGSMGPHHGKQCDKDGKDGGYHHGSNHGDRDQRPSER